MALPIISSSVALLAHFLLICKRIVIMLKGIIILYYMGTIVSFGGGNLILHVCLCVYGVCCLHVCVCVAV